MLHKLKTDPLPFSKVKEGIKNFEIRKNDRAFKVGDEILLEEFTPANYWEEGDEERGYSGEICHRRITYILQDEKYGIRKGYCILALSKI